MTPSRVHACVWTVVLLAAAPAFADDTPNDESRREAQSIAASKAPTPTSAPALPQYRAPGSKVPLFRPPPRGKPHGRVGGGSRGIPNDRPPELYALVPDHTALTASDSPSLFWYIDIPPRPGTEFVFTLLDEESVDPVHESAFPAPEAAGVHRIRLADYGVKLEPGIEYEWSVSIVLDPEQRSADIIASGWISRIEPPTGISSMPIDSSSPEAVSRYAQAGLWYDAFASISNQIEAHPDDPHLREVRAALLRQVGLITIGEGRL